MIEPRVAYIEIDCDIDDFYNEWEAEHTEEPTQKDYDEWSYNKADSFLSAYSQALFLYVRLK